MSDLRTVHTGGLILRAVTADDLAALHEIHADPAVWTHFPAGRHADIDRTKRMVDTIVEAWQRDRLGYWTARAEAEPERVVGIGGVRRTQHTGLLGEVWNVYYRLSPAVHRHGHATELARTGIAAAAEVDPTLPVAAFLLEHNVASRRTAERAGLTLRRAEPDPDVAGTRLWFADRALPFSA